MNISNLFKAGLPHLFVIAAFIVVNGLFFAPQFQGKILQQGDIVSWEAAAKEITTYKAKNGKPLLWTDAMFGGMPAYQIAMEYKGMFVTKIQGVLSAGITGPAGVFLAMMVSFYIMMLIMGTNSWLAAIGAFGFGLATYNLVLLEAGHTNKLNTLVYLPIVVAGLYQLFFKKEYRSGGVLLAVGACGNLAANHIQMTYYIVLCLVLLVLIWAVGIIRKQEWGTLFKVFAIGVLAAVLALGSVASNLWPTYEYTQDTMRGKPILESKAGVGVSSSTTDGLAWDYAMQWSNNWQDVVSVLIPRAAGGASGEKVKSGQTYTALRASGQPLRSDGSMQLPLYWGSLPFTSGPAYFGAVFCFLFVFGLALVRDAVKWWAGLSVLMTVLLSLGSNMEWFQRLFFDYLPVYNKFRAPSSILTITMFFFPLLGMLAVTRVLEGTYGQKEVLRALGIGAGVTGGISLFFALLGPSFFDFVGAGDAGYQQELAAMLQKDRADFMAKDGWRSFFFILAAVGLLWAFIKKLAPASIVVLGLGILVVVDLWGVGRRYLGPESYVNKNAYDSQFQVRPVDQQILSIESSRGNYRVLDLSANTFNSSAASYLHNSIGGYSAAKFQRYQDMIDFHITKGNEQVLDMLNGKYVIAQNQQLQVRNSALGPVWLVDSIIPVGSANAEIEALNTFNAAEQAVVLDAEFGGYIKDFDPVKGGNIRLTKYDPQHLEYEADLPSEQLAVFSEIWYGPNKGWKATIDGKSVEHIRANYILRAMRIPAGKHKVEFVFEPQSVALGSTISSISSLIVLLGFLGVVGFYFWKWAQNPVPPKPLPVFSKPEGVAKSRQTKASGPTPASSKRPKPGKK